MNSMTKQINEVSQQAVHMLAEALKSDDGLCDACPRGTFESDDQWLKRVLTKPEHIQKEVKSSLSAAWKAICPTHLVDELNRQCEAAAMESIFRLYFSLRPESVIRALERGDKLFMPNPNS